MRDEWCGMSEILTLSQIKVPGTAGSKEEAIREAGGILVEAGGGGGGGVGGVFEGGGAGVADIGDYFAVSPGTKEGEENNARAAVLGGGDEGPIDRGGNQGPVAV